MSIANMTIKERIQKFIELHPEVDQKLTPELWVTWKGTRNGKEYRKMYNTTTGDMIEFSDPNDAPDWVSIIKVRSKSSWSRNKVLNLSYSTFYGPNPTNKQGPGKCFTRYNNRVLLNASSNSDMVYFKYDEKLKVMEMSLVCKDTKRYNTKLSKKENIRKWERVPTAMYVFLVDGNKDLYDANGQILTNGYPFDGGWPLTFKAFCSKLGSSDIMYKCGAEFEKFAKDNLYGSGGIPLDPTYGYHVEKWLTYRPRISKNGAVSKKIAELCSYKLTDISDEELLKVGDEPINNGYYYEREHSRVYVDVNSIPDWAVLRIFYYHDDKKRKFHEGFRVYVGNNGDIKLAKRIRGDEWTYSHDITQTYGHQFVILNPQDIPKHKRLSYIYEIASLGSTGIDGSLIASSGKRLLRRIIRLMKAPEIEMLYKAGYKSTALSCLDDPDTPNALFPYWFGTINRKKKDLAAKFGINKKQLEIFNSYFDPAKLKREQHCDVISKIKGTLEVDDISAMDIATFNEMVSLVLQWKTSGGYNRRGDDSNSILTPDYSMPDELEWSKEKQLRYMMKISKITKNWTVNPPLRVYRDFLSMYKKIPEEMRPVYQFDNLSSLAELRQMHDDCLRIYNMEQDKIRNMQDAEKNKMLAKLDLKRAPMLEYEDENYKISLPKKLSEIVREGSSLGHCVGGYTDRHLRGETTILFLRHKDTPNTSFYTIEVHGWKTKNPQMEVAQIHGMRNRWLGCNPEVVPFVMRWLRDKVIKCRDDILLSTSNSYGSYNAPLIPKPQI